MPRIFKKRKAKKHRKLLLAKIKRPHFDDEITNRTINGENLRGITA